MTADKFKGVNMMILEERFKTQDMNKVISFAIIGWIVTFCITYSWLNIHSSMVTTAQKTYENR